ncbi:MAG TPA: DoxX family protein [Blastocatellia bacterium]|nr:DoxX family protein [Blastocatellia bacterium]
MSYWITTGLLALLVGSGGVAQVLHLQQNVEGIHILGYPTYLLTILGIWKVLGAIAIVLPRYPRIKEWAYAGIFFDLTGAAVSHAAAGDSGAYAWHVLVALGLTGLAVASWALRPESRVLGTSDASARELISHYPL